MKKTHTYSVLVTITILFQLIQISINMNYLEKSCVYLEDFISNITGFVFLL